MSESLDVTRRKLRKYLIPAAAGSAAEQADDGDHFPRSKVMRFAFNPRNRRLLMLSGSMLAVFATRMVGADRMGVMADIARSFTRNKS